MPAQIEPTEAFDKECRAAFDQWQAGNASFEVAANRLRQLKREVEGREPANEGRVEQLLGVMQGYRGNYNLGLQHFERAREIYEKLGNQNRVMICNLNMGEIYRQRGDFNRAQRLLDAAYNTALSTENKRVQTVALANRGQALLQMGILGEAMQTLEKAYMLYPDWMDPENPNYGLLAELHYALGRIYMQQGIFEAAWDQAKEGYRLAKLGGKPLEIGFANRIMGEVLTEIGTIPDTDRDSYPLDIDSYFQQSQHAFRDIDAEGELGRTLFAQARSLAKRGRRVQAARRLQESIILFSKLGMVDDATKAAELQAEIF